MSGRAEGRLRASGWQHLRQLSGTARPAVAWWQDGAGRRHGNYYYGFRPSDPKSQWDHGPYNEIATLTFAGELIRPENSKYHTATVTLSSKAGMMEERLTGAAPSIGTLTAHEDELSAYIFVPAERLTELATVAQSGRVQIVQVIGTKLRYRSAQIRNLSIYTQFDDEEW